MFELIFSAIRTQDGAKCRNKNAASTIPFFKNKEHVVYGEKP